MNEVVSVQAAYPERAERVEGMEPLLKELAARRRRIRASRTVEAAFRWAFYATVLACLYLTASKVLGLSVPRSLAVTLLAAIPVAMRPPFYRARPGRRPLGP